MADPVNPDLDASFPRVYDWNGNRVREYADGRIIELIAFPDGSEIEGRLLGKRLPVATTPPTEEETSEPPNSQS